MFSSRLIGSVLLVTIATLGAAQQKRVVGKLGQAMYSVGIHSSASERSHVYFKVKQYAYLIVGQARKENWTSVLMQNGAYGYIPTDSVATLPFTITQTVAPAPRARFLPSRSGAAGVADRARNYIGTPYKWGGMNIQSGIDCSGFVKKMFGTIGLNLPRTAAEQARVGQPIYRLEDLQAGDRLYFYEAHRGKIGHTGIYLGNGYFVHSSSGKHGVATSLLTPGWRKLLIAARR